jgi:hypothetical protein
MRITNVAFFVLVLTSAEGSSTSIYSRYKTPAIYVGADTLGSSGTGSDATACKMFANDQYVVAFSGEIGARPFLDPQGKRRTITEGTYEMGILLGAARTPGQILEVVTWIVMNIQKALLPALAKRYMVTTASFYWFESGKPRNIVIDFESDVIGDKIQFHHDIVRNQLLVDGDISSPPRDFHKVLDQPELLQTAKVIDDPKDQLNFILGKETDLNNRQDVGPPFTIYKLTPGGGEWAQDVGEICGASNTFNSHSK